MLIKNLLQKIEKSTVVVYSKDEICIGTAWFVDMDNYDEYLITCYHVVKEKEGLKISFSQKIDTHQYRFPIEVVFCDKENDLALLKLKNSEDVEKVLAFEHLKIAKNTPLVTGETIFNIAHPYGSLFIASQGIVSNVEYGDCGFTPTPGYNRTLVELKSADHTSSGSAVCSKNGKVVGIISQGGNDVQILEGKCACISCFALENFIANAKKMLIPNKKKELALGKTYNMLKEEFTSLAWLLLVFSLIGQFLQYKIYFNKNYVFATQWYFKLCKLSKKQILGELIILSLVQALFTYCTIICTKKSLLKHKRIKLVRLVCFIVCFSHTIIPSLSAIAELILILILMGYSFFFNKDSNLLNYFFNPKI